MYSTCIEHEVDRVTETETAVLALDDLNSYLKINTSDKHCVIRIRSMLHVVGVATCVSTCVPVPRE